MTLSPAFDSDTEIYKATTTNNSNKVTATATNENATISITVNGSPLINGTSATWQTGENEVIISVSHSSSASKEYRVTVTK